MKKLSLNQVELAACCHIIEGLNVVVFVVGVVGVVIPVGSTRRHYYVYVG